MGPTPDYREGMVFFALGFIAAISGIGIFAWTGSNGGSSAIALVGDQVLSGTELYVIAVLLLLAGAFFVISAIVKTIRKIVAIVALLFVLGGGSYGAIASRGAEALQERCAQQAELSATCARLADVYN